MNTEVLASLAEAGLASAAALALVLVLRQPVRRHFGAEAAYALWLLLPLALVGVLLPASPATAGMLVSRADIGGSLRLVSLPSGLPARDMPETLFITWLLGALATGAWLALRQRRFMAGLGPLRRRPDGLVQSLATRGLPAVIGLRPRIVLPGDFELRYTPVERELVLAHEQVHLRRGDVLATMVFGLLRMLLWFNPLVHLASGRFRQDQELSCDAAVLRLHPRRRRSYGDAMLKSGLADLCPPLGCHWSGSHPLKERLSMLKLPLVSTHRRLAGISIAAGLALAVSGLAWATQPAGAPPRDDGMAASGIEGEAPAYPESAADAGQGGLVMLRVLVGTDGKAEKIEFDAKKSTVPVDSALMKSAMAAAAKWTFNPAMKDGKVVPGWVMVPVRYEPPTVSPVEEGA